MEGERIFLPFQPHIGPNIDTSAADVADGMDPGDIGPLISAVSKIGKADIS